MRSLDTSFLKKLPGKGIDRYFVWLCKLQDKININFRLSDQDLLKIAKRINKICK
jgi:hypothetical protein